MGIVKLSIHVILDRLMKFLVIGFESQNIITTLFDDLSRDFLLTTHRVNRDDGSFAVDQLQSFGNRSAVSITACS